MAIKVQVKETGTSKVQPNLFNNGAYTGMGASEFIGVQPTFGGINGMWNTPAVNAWNTPFIGMNSVPGASANTMTGINGFNSVPTQFGTSLLPYARQNAFAGQLPGMWQREALMSPSAMSMGVAPWMTAGAYGQTAGLAGSTFGLNGLELSQQAAMNGQTMVAHLPIDILDDGIQYLLVADLPGVKIDDLELTVENGLLVIKAVAQSTTFVPGIDVTAPVATVLREKAPVKVYQRTFAIGRDVTVENITASISNGVLTISLPKVNAITGTSSRIRNTVSACG